MTSDVHLQPLVATSYRGLVDALTSISDEAWDTPSLCEGWRVREVVAHATMPVRYDEAAFMTELEAHQFDFTRLSNAVAARDGQLPTAQLLADLASARLHEWTPPQGGSLGALAHAVIHGLDATIPLGLDHPPDEAISVVLTGLTDGGAHEHFGTHVDGRRFEATDLDWSWGDGPALRGAASDLVVVLAGRTLPSGRLEGAPL